VEKYLETQKRWQLPRKAETPLPTAYRLELDTSPELGATDAIYYMSLIGVLRWIVELGRVDICLETLTMWSFMAMPRAGHLIQVLHMFAYLKKYHNLEMVFDPSIPTIDGMKFQVRD
jgi:hypothetical protein